MRPGLRRGRLMSLPFLLTFNSQPCDLDPNTRTWLLLLLSPHLCSCLSDFYLFIFFKPLIPPNPTTWSDFARTNMLYISLMIDTNNLSASCSRMQGGRWEIISSSGLDQMSALLALNSPQNASFSSIQEEKNNLISEMGPEYFWGCSCPFLSQCFQSDLTPLTHVKCQSCVSINQFLCVWKLRLKVF